MCEKQNIRKRNNIQGFRVGVGPEIKLYYCICVLSIVRSEKIINCTILLYTLLTYSALPSKKTLNKDEKSSRTQYYCNSTTCQNILIHLKTQKLDNLLVQSKKGKTELETNFQQCNFQWLRNDGVRSFPFVSNCSSVLLKTASSKFFFLLQYTQSA